MQVEMAALVVQVTTVVEMVIPAVLGLQAAKQPQPKPTAFMRKVARLSI